MLTYTCFKELLDSLNSGNAEQCQVCIRRLQSKVIALNDEVSRLQSRITNFEELLSIPQNIVQEQGLIWLLLTEKVKKGPFCPHCYAAEGALFRLTQASGQKEMICPCCGAVLSRQSFKTKKARIIHFAGA